MIKPYDPARWEDGLPHHPISLKIGEALREQDTVEALDLRFGGDGDNGETLLYMLDEWIEHNGCPCKAVTPEDKAEYLEGMLACNRGRSKIAATMHDGIRKGPAGRRADSFRKNLEAILNAHSMENGSNTPDFILAKYLLGCLAAFDAAVERREEWYGRVPKASPTPKENPT